MGVLDFAGGTVVHMSAGLAALAGALVLGRRQSRAANEAHEPANIPYVLLGTGMLWFGWFGFNAGSALAANETAVAAFATTNTASAAAMLGWVFFDMVRGRKPSALGACIGAVVGLVAITPGAGFVSVRHSIAIGLIAAVVSNVAVHWRTRSSLDDTLDVFPCHGVGGMVGMLLTGVFAQETGLVAGQWQIFGVHLVALVLVSVYAFAGPSMPRASAVSSTRSPDMLMTSGPRVHCCSAVVVARVCVHCGLCAADLRAPGRGRFSVPWDNPVWPF